MTRTFARRENLSYQYLWGDIDEPITEMFNIYELILMNNIYEVILMNQSQKCSIFMRWYWWTNHRNVQYLWGDIDGPITEMFNIYEVILMNQSQKCSIFMRWYWWTNHRNVQYLWGDIDEPITEMFNIYEVILMNQSQKCSIFMRWYWWTNHRNVKRTHQALYVHALFACECFHIDTATSQWQTKLRSPTMKKGW